MPGSKPGERRGGRKPGTPNRATVTRQAEVAASGVTPLDYMLNVMRDSEKPEDVRLDAAKAAAPYVHPKLAAVEMTGEMKLTADQVLAQFMADIHSRGQKLVDPTAE